METKVFRARIFLASGAVVEADITNPDIQVSTENGMLMGFGWGTPDPSTSGDVLAYVKVSEIAAITLREISSSPGGIHV